MIAEKLSSQMTKQSWQNKTAINKIDNLISVTYFYMSLNVKSLLFD